MLSDLIIRNECAHALAILSVATVVEELVELGGVDAVSVARMRLAGPNNLQSFNRAWPDWTKKLW